MLPTANRGAATLSVVLLTHSNELFRVTNTGNLLLDPTSSFCKLCTRWTWQGRKDNEAISRALQSTPHPVLVWTDAPPATTDDASEHQGASRTYIILDGTWQEAKKMFRQGPDTLRAIPRVALRASFPSSYRLRQNFGYVDRFGDGGNGGGNGDGDDSRSSSNSNTHNLLCTAEVVAALLELHGDTSGSTEVRKRLDHFQTTFCNKSYTYETHIT